MEMEVEIQLKRFFQSITLIHLRIFKYLKLNPQNLFEKESSLSTFMIDGFMTQISTKIIKLLNGMNSFICISSNLVLPDLNGWTLLGRLSSFYLKNAMINTFFLKLIIYRLELVAHAQAKKLKYKTIITIFAIFLLLEM